jgi:hypothetical protein
MSRGRVPTRGGSLIVELLFSLALLTLVLSLAGVAAHERHRLAAVERRMAELDQAQDLLERCRHGGLADDALPAGWRLERAAAAPGAASVTVVAPGGMRLTTLCRVRP